MLGQLVVAMPGGAATAFGGSPAYYSVAHRRLVAGADQLLFFTLNQDLFIEMEYGTRAQLPGVPRPSLGFMSESPIDEGNFVDMPSQADVDTAKASFERINGLIYFKLHGSQNWRGDRGMVIGRNKTQAIAEEPLLDWYAELFESAVLTGEHLLCIGYGFRDPHINASIAIGIASGISLHIVSPQDPEHLRNALKSESHGDVLWESIASYHQCGMGTLFPWHSGITSGAPSQDLVRLYRSFLGRSP